MDTSDVDRRRRLQSGRLKQARIAAGYKSARAAALRFHWPEVTFAKHENGERGIGRAARKYARAFKVDEAWLLGLQEEASSLVRGIPVVGDVAIGRWHDVDISTTQQIGERVSAPAKEDNDDERLAVRLADASMNREFPQGSYAIYAPADDDTDASEYVVGDVLYIERTRNGLREMSLRRVASIAGGALRLSTHSNDPKLRQAELSYPPHGNEKIRIVGKVVGKYADYVPA